MNDDEKVAPLGRKVREAFLKYTPITPEIADALEDLSDLPASAWLTLEADYRGSTEDT